MDLGTGSKKLVEQEFLSATSTSTSTSSSMSIMNGESEDQMSNKKSCADCRTTKTPLWRGGPSGPKSLCNACGIRYRKKMVSVMRLSKGNEKIKRERTQTHLDDDDGHNATIGTKTTKRSGSLEVKLNLMALVKKQRCRRKRKLAEEEEAAVLLMALSCGSVFA